ncbi:MAG TPA: hypothetical protein VMN58_10655 [Acidimicrobiales bacterium]|nr:hypothetical protein [Acidimicrobiales bacterium]
MTSTVPQPPGPHLDDEALSALIDGEAMPQTGDHAGACDACEGRLEALRHAARAVADPPPAPDDETRERAIAAAIAAAPAEPARRTGVVTLAPRRRRPAPVWLVSAACLAALILGVGLVRGMDGGDDDSVTMEASPTAGPSVVDGGDLGDLHARSDLRIPVQSALRDGETAAAGEDGDLADDGMNAMTSDDAESRELTTPQRSAAEPGDTCLEEARQLDDGLGALRYRARARFDGAAAVIYAFDVDGDERMSLRVVVLETAGCEVRLVSSFSPR